MTIFVYDCAMETEFRPWVAEPDGPVLPIDPVDPALAAAFRRTTHVVVERYATAEAGEWLYIEDASAGEADYPEGFLVQGNPAYARFVFRRPDGYEGDFEVGSAGAVSHPEELANWSTEEIVAWAIAELIAHAEQHPA